MKHRWKQGLLAAACVLALTLAHKEAQANPQVGGPCANNAPCAEQAPCPGFDGRQMQTLTDEQRAKYYAITKEFEPKLRELNDQLFVKKHELEALKHAAQPDASAVRSCAQEIVKLRAERRAVQQAREERIEKECGIKRPARPIPGVDMPFRGPHGPRGFGPHGPHSPHGYPGPHGPMHQ